MKNDFLKMEYILASNRPLESKKLKIALSRNLRIGGCYGLVDFFKIIKWRRGMKDTNDYKHFDDIRKSATRLMGEGY